MGSLPWKARVYILLLAALMAGAVFFSILAIGGNLNYWIVVLAVAATIAALDALSIRNVGIQIAASIANAVKFAAVLLFPIPVCIIGTFLGTLIGEIALKRAWFKILFNTAAMTLTWAVTAWVYSVLSWD